MRRDPYPAGYEALRRAIGAFARAFNRLSVVGEEHVPPVGQGALLVASHEGMADPIYVCVAARRRFSECMLYGRYVDDVTGGAGHFHQSDPFCHIYWNGPRLDRDGFARFVDAMAPQQVAVGVQSFTGTDIADLRRWIASD